MFLQSIFIQKGIIMKAIVLSICVGLFFTACTSSGVNSVGGGEIYTYKEMNFGSNRTTSFKRGVVDGCDTAAGDYRKDHNAFNIDQNYRMGWGDGRLQCYDINKEKDR